ncbi:MAG: dTMP kinase [Vulcanimicrobiaceae bacterium]
MVATREPGGTPLGDALRGVFVTPGVAIAPMAEAFVVNASRAQHVADVVEPALRAGSVVLCDRFGDATLAYQGYGRGLDLATLRALVGYATGGRVPDLTLLVDIDVTLSQLRVAARARASGDAIDRLEREGIAFHERVRAGYLDLARAEARIVVLDGALSPEALLERAAAIVLAKLET